MIKKIIKSEKGMGMTEILVAFVILLMCMAMVMTCMRLSSGLMQKAKNEDTSYSATEKAIASGEYSTSNSSSTTLNFGSFRITTNTEDITANGQTFHIYSTES